MIRQTQQGMATLLVTSLLLGAVLLLVMASYRSVFYQLKREQNEVISRTQHWQAEGILQCVLAKASEQKRLSQMLAESCVEEDEQIHLVASGHQRYLLQVEVGFVVLRRELQFPTVSPTAPLTLRGELELAAGAMMIPDAGEWVEDNLWRCRLIAYQGRLVLGGELVNHGLHTSLPYAEFPPSQACFSGYQTVVNRGSSFEQDVVVDPQLAPFENLFGTARHQWFEVMSQPEFFKIAHQSLTDSEGVIRFSQAQLPQSQVISDCAQQLHQAFFNGENLIWIYGSCHLDTDDLFALKYLLNPASSTFFGALIVIQNGVLSLSGEAELPIMIYQLIEQPLTSQQISSGWQAIAASQRQVLNQALAQSERLELEQLVYFQHGDVRPQGGLVLDIAPHQALVASALEIRFDRDVLNAPLQRLRSVRWRKGSWYAK
ncbi:hypothetical protein [Vibrio olivae]|uniref:Uncharacterized protein n=1 Tax=Vibrio olivae TaxID=1243002 RepID=A0ABV5HLB5_9VIBR